MTARRLLLAAAACLAAFGLWQLGGAGYIHAKAALAQILLERAWGERLAGAPADAARPWPWADTAPVAHLTVPRLDIDEVVLAGASGRTLAFGPGHLSGTALPGRAGHAVLAGHRDTHFRFLRDLRPGDEVRIQRPDGRTVVYRVDGREIVDARTARIAPAAGRTVLTLVTCYPLDAISPGGPLRLAVFAHAEDGLAGAARGSQTASEQKPALLAGANSPPGEKQ